MATQKSEIDAPESAAVFDSTGKLSLPTKLALFATMILLGSLVALVLAEIALRMAQVKPAAPNVGDALLGLDNQPHTTWRFDVPEYGGTLIRHTNNLGFHKDEDTLLVKRPNVYRIAIVGDSQTAGWCTNRENYPDVLEQKLNVLAGARKYEVLDAGVGRYSPYQYYLKAQRDVLPLKPDRIIVALYLGNDYMDLVREDDRPYLTIDSAGRFRSHPPRFVVFDDPNAEPSLLDSSRVYSLLRSALGPSVYYQYTRGRILMRNLSRENRGLWDIARYMIEVKRLSDVSLGLTTQSLLQFFWFQTFPETFSMASALNRHVIELFKEMCERNGIALTYILIPTKVEIEPEDLRGTLAEVAARDRTLTVQRWRAFEDRVADDALKACGELGVEVIDLRQPMIARRHGIRRYYPRDMHLNRAGNELVAQILFENLARNRAKESTAVLSHK